MVDNSEPLCSSSSSHNNNTQVAAAAIARQRRPRSNRQSLSQSQSQHYHNQFPDNSLSMNSDISIQQQEDLGRSSIQRQNFNNNSYSETVSPHQQQFFRDISRELQAMKVEVCEAEETARSDHRDQNNATLFYSEGGGTGPENPPEEMMSAGIKGIIKNLLFQSICFVSF